jgi:purine-nucleoside phosphorylase
MSRVSHPPRHLRPHADVAERVILPGDPGRALRLAQVLLDPPAMLNHHRGLWGYTGPGADGAPLTIQATGMGGPSVAVVAEELVSLGARRLVRAGTARALSPALPAGAFVVPRTVLAGDGTSRALGAPARLGADPALVGALRAAAPSAGEALLASADLVYDPAPARAESWAAAGAAAVDLETAALLAVARRRGVAAAAVVLVSGGAAPDVAPAELEAAEQELGRIAAAALGAR